MQQTIFRRSIVFFLFFHSSFPSLVFMSIPKPLLTLTSLSPFLPLNPPTAALLPLSALTHSFTHPARLWSLIQGCFHPLPSSARCPLGRERCQRSLRLNAHRWMRVVVLPCVFTYLCLIWRVFHLAIVASICLNTSHLAVLFEGSVIGLAVPHCFQLVTLLSL